jgi:hypothetical protein
MSIFSTGCESLMKKIRPSALLRATPQMLPLKSSSSSCLSSYCLVERSVLSNGLRTLRYILSTGILERWSHQRSFHDCRDFPYLLFRAHDWRSDLVLRVFRFEQGEKSIPGRLEQGIVRRRHECSILSCLQPLISHSNQSHV